VAQPGLEYASGGRVVASSNLVTPTNFSKAHGVASPHLQRQIFSVFCGKFWASVRGCFAIFGYLCTRIF
ncbi:MAG: hypothetical protein K2L05_07915, partial [Muribaculaceae bacterium]|nr:hypothetical protein [Muribaculaceae bacterium]